MDFKTVEQCMNEAHNYLKTIAQKPRPDQSSLYANLLATKLRTLDDTTRQYAMLYIDNFLFTLSTQNITTHPPLQLNVSITLVFLLFHAHLQPFPISRETLPKTWSTQIIHQPPPRAAVHHTIQVTHIHQFSYHTCMTHQMLPAPSPFEDREKPASSAIQRASLAQSQAAPRQAGYMARLNTILCQ
jgi:hypothetical protein